MKIKCIWSGCPMTWKASEEDPDATLDDAMHHVARAHNVGLSVAHIWVEEA